MTATAGRAISRQVSSNGEIWFACWHELVAGVGGVDPGGDREVALRQIPFSFIKLMRDSPLVSLLAVLMPAGVMMVLVIYTIFERPFSREVVLSTLAGIGATVALHVWRRSPALSIIGGTAAYVACLNLIFA